MNREELVIQIANTYYPECEVRVIAGDASFRKYYRISTNTQTFIGMDSDPLLENNEAFILAQQILSSHHIHVPIIHHAHPNEGIFILEDFGDVSFNSVVTQHPAHTKHYYQQAIDTLIHIQTINASSLTDIPQYDHAHLLREMNLAKEWYQPDFAYDDIFNFILSEITTHPQVIVHRDYHSRNLMMTTADNIGVIDFQDMVIGSYMYDLVSLLKDVYIQLDSTIIMDLLEYYIAQSPLTQARSYKECVRDFELIGVQRHLKILGIFNRLHVRDGKAQYLDDLPLTKLYLTEMGDKYPELAPLGELVGA